MRELTYGHALLGHCVKPQVSYRGSTLTLDLKDMTISGNYDGLLFHKESINVERLFDIAHSPKSLLEAMTGDDEVFVGVAPDDNSWYLRFYVDWDENETNLMGRFDVTFPPELAGGYRNEILGQLEIYITKQDADEYYQTSSYEAVSRRGDSVANC